MKDARYVCQIREEGFQLFYGTPIYPYDGQSYSCSTSFIKNKAPWLPTAGPQWQLKQTRKPTSLSGLYKSPIEKEGKLHHLQIQLFGTFLLCPSYILLLTAAPKPGWRRTPGTLSLYLRQNKTTPNKPRAAACSKFLPTELPSLPLLLLHQHKASEDRSQISITTEVVIRKTISSLLSSTVVPQVIQ